MEVNNVAIELSTQFIKEKNEEKESDLFPVLQGA